MYETKIEKTSEIMVIAEIGQNHNGDINIAKQLIEAAAIAGADYAKFQKRNIKELLTEEEYLKPYNNPNSFGKTYGEHREFLEFDVEQHAYLKEYCEEKKIGYACSVWGIEAAKEIISLNPDYIKIPSAMNLNFPLLKYVRDNFKDKIHISLGMTTAQERDQIFDFMNGYPTVYYWCTSSYPCRFEDVNLLNLKELFCKFKDVGYSSHSQGIAVEIAAVIFGASYIEKHFTLSRDMKGNDHSASLEFEGLKKLVRDIEHVSKTFTHRTKILPSEMESYKKMKKVIPLEN